MRSIKRLPEAIQRSVRSGVVICDLTRIVEELVCNSLDSGATEVSVAVDVGSYYVKVVDNGSGITRDGLVLLGEQYATSKLEHLAPMDAVNENFDFHGKTLCSISDVSLLEILTKAYGKPNGYRKVIKNSKCLFLGISDDRQDPGTTVTVRDIFFNQPVRRKLMQSSSKKVLDSIKSTLLRIALVHHDVSFIVLDLESMDKVLHTRPSSSPSLILSHTFGFENSATLNKLKLSDGELKLSGFISGPRDAIQQKAIQYFYINSRFIQKGPIHKLVNQLAAKFDLLTSCQLSANLQSEKRMKYALCPTFILNLRCPRSYYDIYTSEQSGTLVEFKDWRPVLTFIENGVMHLWSESNPRDASEIRIRCKKQNFQTPLYVHSPEKKKQCRNNDFTPALEECVPSFLDPSIEVSKVEKFQWGENLRSESDYIIPSIVGCSAGCRAMLNEDVIQHRFPYDIFSPQHVAYRHDNKTVGLSTASLGDILPAFNIGMNDVSTLGEGSVSAGCLKFHDDINTDQESSRSFLRSCSLGRNLLQEKKSPSIKERFRFGNDGIELKKTRIESHGCMEDETDLLISGNGLWFDDATAIPSSLHIEDNMHESEYFTGGSLQASFKSTYSPMTTSEIGYDEYSDDSMYNNFFDGRSGMEIDLIREFSAETASEDLRSSNLKKRDRLQQSNFTNLHPEKEKGIDEYLCGNFEAEFLSNSIERFQEKDWQPLTIGTGECPKSYPTALSSEISAMKHECYEFDGRIQVSVSRGKKRLIRSNSAPPFYRRKQRYLDLANSSTMSAKSNFNNSYTPKEPKNSSCARVHSETRKLKCLQKSFGHEKTPPHDKPAIDCSSTRPWLEMTCNADSIQNGMSEHDGEFINTESVECLETKETQDASDTAWKWRKCNLPSRECVTRSDNKKDPILDISSEILNRGGDCIVPKSIDRKCLQDAKVLNQLDKKFIAVVAGNTLALIDQHAADERIRLEELRHKVLTGELRRTVYLDAEQELVLPEIGHQLLQNYAEQIQTWGWTCSINSQDPSSFTKNLDFLQTRSTSVKLLSVPCILDTNLTDIDLLEFLQQLADTDGSSTVPPSVHRILNNKACRGAIMFGDTLLPSECSLIVEELKQTSLCFQCAHGRPTTVPLVDLEALHKTISKLGSHEPWHELYQHKVSLGRMKQRLRPSTG